MAGSVFIVVSQKLKGRYLRWSHQSEQAVDSTDMAKLVGIGEMRAIPSNEKIAAVVRGERQMQGVAHGFSGHDPMANVCRNDLQHCCVDGQYWQARNQFQATGSRWEFSSSELINDSNARC